MLVVSKPKTPCYVEIGTPLNLTELSRLELQGDSLAEVVLQNRRGLNLLFLEQDRFCMALSETCCFYANNSGIMWLLKNWLLLEITV